MVQIKMPDAGSVHNIVDAGSSDPGAYSLGSGKVFTGRAAGLVLLEIPMFMVPSNMHPCITEFDKLMWRGCSLYQSNKNKYFLSVCYVGLFDI